MFQKLRRWHRWVGLVCAVFFLTISVTGFMLANKDRWTWVKPGTASGTSTWGEGSLSLSEIARIACAEGHPELRSPADVDRIELHAGKGVAKVRSKEGFLEVQVDSVTGKVLLTGRRWDQLTENIHDLRYFGVAWRDYLLPLVAVGLFSLACSGVAMFLTPVIRRRRFERSEKGSKPKENP